VVVPRAVLAAKRLIEEGETNVVAVLAAMRNELSVAPDARVQYLEVVETTTLQPVKTLVPGQEVLAAVAVYFSQTRLIDNAFARVPG
jgi:pantoate--beta-alanine ligase